MTPAGIDIGGIKTLRYTVTQKITDINIHMPPIKFWIAHNYRTEDGLKLAAFICTSLNHFQILAMSKKASLVYTAHRSYSLIPNMKFEPCRPSVFWTCFRANILFSSGHSSLISDIELTLSSCPDPEMTPFISLKGLEGRCVFKIAHTKT